MAEIIRINEDSWRIEDGGVRFFLLCGSDRALLVDSGMNTPDARKIAESITELPVELLNTHADRDHVAGNAAFGKAIMSPAEEAHYREGGWTGEVVPVREGDVIDLGGRKLLVIDIPGHEPGAHPEAHRGRGEDPLRRGQGRALRGPRKDHQARSLPLRGLLLRARRVGKGRFRIKNKKTAAARGSLSVFLALFPAAVLRRPYIQLFGRGASSSLIGSGYSTPKVSTVTLSMTSGLSGSLISILPSPTGLVGTFSIL